MILDYPVVLGNENVGKIQLVKEGLYYKICCRCRLKNNSMYRLLGIVGNHRENLGILIPVDGGFGLDCRIPVKHLGEGTMEFRIQPKHDSMVSGKFVPIRAEEPFAYLQQLKESFLVYQDGQKGIRIMEE